jgi:hypothetical protein
MGPRRARWKFRYGVWVATADIGAGGPGRRLAANAARRGAAALACLRRRSGAQGGAETWDAVTVPRDPAERVRRRGLRGPVV